MIAPIDPTDVVALNEVRQKAASDVQRRWIESRCTFPLIPVENNAVVAAVARAVLPEGYVAVPVADLRVALDWHGAAPEPLATLWSLIPAEATDEA